MAVAKKCKHCGKWLDEDIPKSSSAMIRCPICDEDIPADSTICPECGEPLVHEQKGQISSTRSKNKHIVPLIVIAILILLGGLIIFLPSKDERGHEQDSSTDMKEEVQRVAPKNEAPKPTYEVLEKWNLVHNSKDIAGLCEVYADTVIFYQSTYPLSKVISSKQRLFDKNPNFHQEYDHLEILPVGDGYYRFNFDKMVWTDFADDDYKTYPSYLIVKRIGLNWKITAESDSITDANIAKRAKKNGPK